jgi:hypothetical protein
MSINNKIKMTAGVKSSLYPINPTKTMVGVTSKIPRKRNQLTMLVGDNSLMFQKNNKLTLIKDGEMSKTTKDGRIFNPTISINQTFYISL